MKKLRSINLQLFSEGAASGGDGSTDAGSQPDNVDSQSQDDSSNQDDDFEERVKREAQIRADKQNGDLNKTIADLKQQLEDAKKSKMSDDEKNQYELKQKNDALIQKEAELLDRENKLYAVNSIKSLGIECSSQDMITLQNLATSGVKDSKEIDIRLQAVKSIIDNSVKAECDKRFKENGRTPQGASKPNEGDEGSIAKRLGVKRAEINNKSNSILDHYVRKGKK